MSATSRASSRSPACSRPSCSVARCSRTSARGCSTAPARGSGSLPGAVTLTLLTNLMPESSAQDALERSWELRGLLAELQREHTVNRALMHQELAFLDHLLRLADGSVRRRLRLGRRSSDRDPVARRQPARVRPAGLSDHDDLIIHGTADGAPGPPRQPGGDRHDRPQHRQREHARATRARRPTSPRARRSRSRRSRTSPAAGSSSAPASTSRRSPRIRNTFLDVQYRSQNTAYNDASTQTGILDQVQTGLAEPSDHGISSQLSAFWSAWSDVANNPASPAARQAVIDTATTLTQSFNAVRPAALDDPVPGRAAVHRSDRHERSGRERRQPDRDAQPIDQSGDGSAARTRTTCWTSATR